MESLNLGHVSPLYKGAYNSGTTYTEMDVVTYQGSSYVSKIDNNTSLPTDTTKWQMLASKGDPGTTDYNELINKPDLTVYQEKANLTTTIDNASTDTQYPSAKATYTELEKKYVKPNDGIPKTDLDSSVQTSLGKADTAVQDVSGKENISNKVTQLTSESTDTQYPSAKCVYDFVETEIKRPLIYGIERKVSSTASEWTRTDDAKGLVANATLDGSNVSNSFDYLEPWSDIRSCNLDESTGHVNAWYGDYNFHFDGSNGNVMTYFPKFYYRVWQETRDNELYDKIQISHYPFPNSIESDEFYVARYKCGLDNSKPVSWSGVGPEVNRSITSFRTLFTDNGFTQMDYHYFLIQLLYLVEYADYNSQAKLGNGVSSVSYAVGTTSLLTETGVNRVVIPTDTNFQVGNTICIGTSQGNMSIAKYRTITAINSYDEGGVTGTELIFDGDPVDITTGNWAGCVGQLSGGCDALGMKSGSIYNDSKHSAIYRGVEDFLGNVFEWVDGINIKDHQAYVCTDPSEYVSDKFTSPYEQLGYVCSSTDGWGKELGFDANHPLFRLTKSVGGGNNKNLCDYYSQNTGNRVVRVGGYFNNGAYDGCFYWNLNSGSTITYVNIGGRFLYIPS